MDFRHSNQLELQFVLMASWVEKPDMKPCLDTTHPFRAAGRQPKLISTGMSYISAKLDFNKQRKV
jgi:hypothetical protein